MQSKRSPTRGQIIIAISFTLFVLTSAIWLITREARNEPPTVGYARFGVPTTWQLPIAHDWQAQYHTNEPDVVATLSDASGELQLEVRVSAYPIADDMWTQQEADWQAHAQEQDAYEIRQDWMATAVGEVWFGRFLYNSAITPFSIRHGIASGLVTQSIANWRYAFIQNDHLIALNFVTYADREAQLRPLSWGWIEEMLTE